MKISVSFKKRAEGKNFFDLPAKEKKQIINNAVRGSNRLQLELVRGYGKTI